MLSLIVRVVCGSAEVFADIDTQVANNSIRESSSPYNQGPKFSFSLILLQNSYLFQISRLYYI